MPTRYGGQIQVLEHGGGNRLILAVACLWNYRGAGVVHSLAKKQALRWQGRDILDN